MSRQRVIARALARLTAPQAILAPERAGAGFGLFPGGDRRRRPVCRVTSLEVRELEAQGAIAAISGADAFALTEAGRARVKREAAPSDEEFQEQHRKIVPRTVVEADGALRHVRGFETAAAIKRLAMLRDANGAPFLAQEELDAAARLRADWETGQIGLVRGSDWSAPPRGGAARGPGNAREGAVAAHCDARRRVSDALDQLAPPLRRAVERVCLRDEGVVTLEREEGWPERSGKIALKLALAQLAAGGRRSG